MHTYRVRMELPTGGRFTIVAYARDPQHARRLALRAARPGAVPVAVARQRP